MKVKDKIDLTINENGYITIDEFMRTALSSCSNSYYRNKNPLGVYQDFITSPEISQMFGEIVGVWVLEKWIELGRPNKINLVELGPGQGTLLKNLFNITKNIQNFHDALDIYLIEINEILIEIQKKSLSNFKVTWLKEISRINSYPTIIIANEFFDSLPIKQYIKYEDIWYERIIIKNLSNKFEYDKIKVDNIDVIKDLNQYKLAQDGSIIESSLDIKNYINLISNFFGENKSHYLFIDYGYYIEPIIRAPNQCNSTLQAIKNHKYCDIFYDIGNCDLTSHVDFYMLSYFAKNSGFKTKSVISQRDFLINYGINQRLQVLCKDKDIKLQNILHNQYNRLVKPREMGDLFKVLEIYK